MKQIIEAFFEYNKLKVVTENIFAGHLTLNNFIVCGYESTTLITNCTKDKLLGEILNGNPAITFEDSLSGYSMMPNTNSLNILISDKKSFDFDIYQKITLIIRPNHIDEWIITNL